MDIFISWSGARSKKLAEALREWLPNVIQTLEPWCSESDLEKGSRWLREVSEKLESTNFGIICLTPENIDEPWVLFEAGALSKTLGSSKVCPILLGLDPSDLKGPLSQFQATRFNKDEILKLIEGINKALPSNRLTAKQLEETFDLWWPRLEEKIKEIPASAAEAKPHRTDRDILEEILNTVRILDRRRSTPLEKIFESLSPREEKVIRMKYGIGEKRQYTYEEIGKVFGISSDKIEELEKGARRKLLKVNTDWDSSLTSLINRGNFLRNLF